MKKRDFFCKYRIELQCYSYSDKQ